MNPHTFTFNITCSVPSHSLGENILLTGKIGIQAECYGEAHRLACNYAKDKAAKIEHADPSKVGIESIQLLSHDQPMETAKTDSFVMFNEWFPEIDLRMAKNIPFRKIEITCVDGTKFIYEDSVPEAEYLGLVANMDYISIK